MVGTCRVASGTQYGDQFGLTNSSIMSITSSAVRPGSTSIRAIPSAYCCWARCSTHSSVKSPIARCASIDDPARSAMDICHLLVESIRNDEHLAERATLFELGQRVGSPRER